jgi:hypothetical protein
MLFTSSIWTETETAFAWKRQSDNAQKQWLNIRAQKTRTKIVIAIACAAGNISQIQHWVAPKILGHKVILTNC